MIVDAAVYLRYAAAALTLLLPPTPLTHDSTVAVRAQYSIMAAGTQKAVAAPALVTAAISSILRSRAFSALRVFIMPPPCK